jgi:tRNA pseudouridine55 synthase
MDMQKIIAIYKPKGPTSNDVVQELKRITGEKVGHAGTLDPLAEGVLVVGIGREATKSLSAEVKKEKEYLAKIKLGETSTTDDEEGEKTVTDIADTPDKADIRNTINKFIGKIKQIPPVFSAVKIEGKEAYKFARKGVKPLLLERDAEVKEIEILGYEWPFLELRVVTGPGVYVRALARDIGKELKVGAYLAGLKRTRVGGFTEKDSLTVEEFKKQWQHSKNSKK